MHYGPEQKKTQQIAIQSFTFLQALSVANEEAVRASKASSAEQANEWVVQANVRMDEHLAQYLHLD